MEPMTRREALRLGVSTAALAVVGSPVTGAPSDAAAAIAAFTGGKVEHSGKITLDLADTVEDGNSVPLSIAIDGPMQANDYVSDVLVVADSNPWPRVATFHFTPLSGRAEVATRIRLTASQNVIVVAKTADGRLFRAHKHVEVTIGACT